MWIATFCFVICFNAVYGAQELSFSATYVPTSPIATSKIQFDLTFFPNGVPVEVAQIINPTTGLLSDSACQFTTAASTLITGTSTLGDPIRTLRVFIDGSSGQFQNSAGTSIPCYFQTTAPGQYKFYIRGLASATTSANTDREYLVEVSGINVVNNIVVGSGFSGPTPRTETTVPATTYTHTLTVVDSATKTDQITLPLGTPTQLKYTFTATGYQASMVLAGARLSSCQVDKQSSFAASISFIGSDGCFKDVIIFDNMNTNTGFTRHSSSAVSGGTKTYIAYSPVFEMSAFEKNPVTGSNTLYFKCEVSYCLDDSNAAASGNCGGDHCAYTSGKKKRDVSQTDATVFASVNITASPSANDRCNACTKSTTFQASTASLGTLGAILLGFLILMFTNTRKSLMRFLESRSISSYSTSSVTGSHVT